MTVAVVDSNGDPVGNLDLTVSWASGSKNITTASNGKAFVDVPNGTDIEITVHDEEYVRNSPFVKFNVGSEEVKVPVSLGGQATLTVQSANGPESDATIEVYDSGISVETLTTDAKGEATTRRLERGQYGIRVTKPGFSSTRRR